MPFPKFTLDSQERPTLPSIHTLDLPLHVKYQKHNHKLRCSPLKAPHGYHHHDRQVSTSSSHTSASRSDSPTPSPSNDIESEINHSNPYTSTKFRLVPCPLETADAVILVPPPNAHHTPNVPNYVPRTGHAQGLLLVGPALQQVRQPQRQLARGARIHPYRVVRGEKPQNSRRSSIISITSFSHAV